ncbi:Clr5 domain-containing protein [Nemania sp. FL0916]|nr:Clr5 domain-containing protein [Nemania sp. FL0916]
MATNTSSKRLSDQQWARHELTIRQLYLDEDESLQSVMSKMARDHGFNATKSQYETRLRKWGITKNRKRGDWIAVAHQIQRREAAGKTSAVFIQGNLVSDVKIQMLTSITLFHRGFASRLHHQWGRKPQWRLNYQRYDLSRGFKIKVGISIPENPQNLDSLTVRRRYQSIITVTVTVTIDNSNLH